MKITSVEKFENVGFIILRRVVSGIGGRRSKRMINKILQQENVD